MSVSNYIEITLFLVVLAGISPLLGIYIARVLSDDPSSSHLRRMDAWAFKFIGSQARGENSWSHYLRALLVFNLMGFAALVLVQRLQGHLPLNPQGLGPVPFWLAVNTAVSFVTNTNWQAYSGEATLSYFTQVIGLTVQNFVSAATGIAVMVALARGLRGRQTGSVGNFWRDLTRATLYVLLPLSLIWAILLVSEGVVQNFAGYVTVHPLSGGEQIVPMGPAASQVAIKQLGTNGGGFFGVNSAHPFENPTPLSNFLQVLGILLIPAALPFAFGKLVGNIRHGAALFFSMLVLFLLTFIPLLWSELQINTVLGAGFLEGKEIRFGVSGSALWAGATTVASNGSVNSMLDSFSPLAGGLALLNILMGEVVFGGVGSGVYGIVLFAILTVFIAGLMVGRTPEYLGKKIEAREVLPAVLGIIVPSAVILLFSALALSTEAGLSSVLNKGPHGLTEVLYAFASGAGNNGSAFGGLNANTGFYNFFIALAMVIGRYGVIIPVLYIAGCLAQKKTVPASSGTFSTEGTLFSFLLCAIILIVGALTFFPVLSLGPIMEHLLMLQGRAF